MTQRHERGVTLMEGLITTVILVIGVTALVTALTSHYGLVRMNRERTEALHLAQNLLEAQVNQGFSQMVTAYAVTNNGVHEVLSAKGDALFASAAPPLNTTASAQLRIRDVDGGAPGINVVELRATVCWQSNTRFFGEDNGAGIPANALNGRLDAGEDADGNGVLTCPATVETRLARG